MECIVGADPRTDGGHAANKNKKGNKQVSVMAVPLSRAFGYPAVSCYHAHDYGGAGVSRRAQTFACQDVLAGQKGAPR